ncbi:DUF2459 domain-containing protein [Luteolibacter sp. SL250]|uniref:DUF2459 domain-containing protein n=1 Tax=Luteolibacter sp. SL250 TaxID=2995170 RepID=UPI00226EE4C8|nr:DUF2459 domain-containing protein [Luteolibacter sp. SL250]WAC21899.1 DUF2459 domain-containing protein [Luteolibacter sp. SL250]
MRVLRSTGRALLLLAVPLLATSCGLRLPVHRKPVATKPAETRTVLDRENFRIKDGNDPDVVVYLLADTLHTGVVFPYDWLVDSGFVPPEGFKETPVAVSMSWGNRDAYVEKRWLSPWKVFRALCTPSPSVMEIIPVNWNIPEVVPHQRVYQKLVPRSKGPEVAAFLNNCSRMDADGKPVNIGPSSWGSGVLLESRHAYFLPRICNIWTVQALEATGCNMNAWMGLSANGVIRQAVKPGNDFEQIWLGPEEKKAD